MAPAAERLLLFAFSSPLASESARDSSEVVKRLNASFGSPILLAALIRGASMNATSSSVMYRWFTRATAQSFCSPTRGDFRITKSPYFASTLFSPISGTMSAIVASPAISRSHFSHPSGMPHASPRSRAYASTPHTSLNASPAPQSSLNGYVSPSCLGSIMAKAGGGVSGTVWWSVTMTSMPCVCARCIASVSVIPQSTVMSTCVPCRANFSIPNTFTPNPSSFLLGM